MTMKWTRRETDGAYVSDAGYVILLYSPNNWVANRSDTEPIPGFNAYTRLTTAKHACENDLAARNPVAAAPGPVKSAQPVEDVTITLSHVESTVDYKVAGAEPLASLRGPGELMSPRSVRIHNYDGSRTATIFGLRISAKGKTLKTWTGRGMDVEDDDCPPWFVNLMKYELGRAQ